MREFKRAKRRSVVCKDCDGSGKRIYKAKENSKAKGFLPISFNCKACRGKGRVGIKNIPHSNQSEPDESI